MVTKKILSVIRKAIADPEAYSSGVEKNQLRAAFDALTSQVYASLFGDEPLSRMNARKKLNQCKKKGHTDAQWKIIKLLREAIRESETSLYAAGYEDHVEDISAFIEDHLTELYEALA
jgi:lysine/ornithine N-monooxygenase